MLQKFSLLCVGDSQFVLFGWLSNTRQAGSAHSTHHMDQIPAAQQFQGIAFPLDTNDKADWTKGEIGLVWCRDESSRVMAFLWIDDDWMLPEFCVPIYLSILPSILYTFLSLVIFSASCSPAWTNHCLRASTSSSVDPSLLGVCRG